MLTDPIADMLTRIRNAHLALHKEVSVPRSKMKEAMATILKQEGYVEDVTVDERNITIALKYVKGRPAITGLKRISKPGRRVYAPIVIILASTFAEYLYNNIANDIREIDYADFDDIITQNLGKDISQEISNMTIEKFAAAGYWRLGQQRICHHRRCLLRNWKSL